MYNKVRGILRAKKGSQIPKLLLGGNSFNVSNVQLSIFGNSLFNSNSVGFNLTGLKSDNDVLLNQYRSGNTYPEVKGITIPFKEPAPTDSLNNSKSSIFKKAGDFLTSDTGYNVMGAAADGITNAFFKDTVDSEGFGIVNLGIDTVGNALMGVNPMAGAIVKGAGMLINGINSIGGKKADSFSINQATAEQVGGSYGGSMNMMTDAASKAGKKYGLFNNRSRKKANRQIKEANRQLNIMTGIAEEASDMQAMAGNNLNYLSYQTNLSGGYDLQYIRAAKQGMKINDRINLVKSRNIFKHVINTDTKLIEEFKEGGVILNLNWKPEIIEEEIILNLDWKPTVESFLDGGKTSKKTRTIEELIEYAKKENPRFILRMSEPIRDIDLGKGERGTHLMGWGDDGKGNAFVFSLILEDDDGNLVNYGEKAFSRSIEKNNYLKMSPEEAELFTNSGIDENGNLYGYKIGWPEFFKPKQKPIGFPKLNETSSKDLSPYEFKQGGKTKQELETPEIEETTLKNVIPEGALHKNKHNIEHTEGLTLKGIPVVDNEGEQLAEIEHSEIIFTLEVTKKLEELYEDYYNNEHSLKEKDEAAIEAGKLLVYQILFNTDDRTDLINNIQT